MMAPPPLIVTLALVRPWYRHWGAPAAEITRPMPLDDQIPDPTLVTTRAIAIQVLLPHRRAHEQRNVERLTQCLSAVRTGTGKASTTGTANRNRMMPCREPDARRPSLSVDRR